MHDNLKIIIKIPITIYLSFLVLFTSVLLHWYYESWVYKNLTFIHDTEKTVSTSNRSFSVTIRYLRTIFNLIKFYTSDLKVLYSLIISLNRNSIQVHIIFAAPKFCFSKCDIPPNNAQPLKLIPPLDSSYQRQ